MRIRYSILSLAREDIALPIDNDDDFEHLRGFAEGVSCDQCGKWKVLTVAVGAVPDYESSTAYLCLPCLRGALEEAEELMEYLRWVRNK